MVVIIVLLTFLSVTALSYASFYLVNRRREAIRLRMLRFTQMPAARGGRERGRRGLGPGEFDPEGEAPGVVPALRRLLASLARLFETRSISRQIEREIERAGVPLKGSEFVALMGVAALAGSFFAYLAGGFFLSLFGFGAGLIAPRLGLGIAAGRRLKAFNAQINDALTMMSGALKSGYSFLQAMEMVAKEMPPPIRDEFSRTLKEMSIGVPTEDALRTMAERVGSDDLDLVVTAVLIQRQVGGNLAEVLDNIAETVRERIRIKDEIKTLTAQGRISGAVIALLPVGIALFITMLNPGYIAPLFTTPVGWAMLGGSVVSEIIGALVIKKIVSIEV